MTPNEILSLDALQLSTALNAKEVSCVEVMEATLERIDQVNGKHKAIIQLRDSTELIALARKADEIPRKGWLHGIPIAIKDLSNVKGIPTSVGGSPLFKDFVPGFSDAFVENIEHSGAIIIGKTNTPECGLGSHTYNSRWGTTVNPFDTSKSAGGSSGGAATAVALGMLCLADGSDMMGSLRNPAGWNNLYSHRPTAGMILETPPSEKNPLPYPISTPGPTARHPVDCALLLETMAGRTSFDASELDNLDDDSITGTRIGWLGDWNGNLKFEDGILTLCRSSLDAVKSHGVEIDDIVDEPGMKTILPQLWRAWNSVRSAMIASTFTPMFDLDSLLGDSSRIKEELKWEIKQGLSVTADDLRHAKQVEEEYSTFLDGLFKSHDFLALPSAQVWPFEANQAWPTAIGDAKMDTYHRWMEVCVPVSFGGLPCTTIPVGFGDNGLPMGLQLFARHGDDLKLLQFSVFYHNWTDWPSKVDWINDEGRSLTYNQRL